MVSQAFRIYILIPNSIPIWRALSVYAEDNDSIDPSKAMLIPVFGIGIVKAIRVNTLKVMLSSGYYITILFGILTHI